MSFNQKIWDALCFAVRGGWSESRHITFKYDENYHSFTAQIDPKAVEVLSEYAAACDGYVNIVEVDRGEFKSKGFDYTFTPNPSSQY